MDAKPTANSLREETYIYSIVELAAIDQNQLFTTLGCQVNNRRRTSIDAIYQIASRLLTFSVVEMYLNRIYKMYPK